MSEKKSFFNVVVISVLLIGLLGGILFLSFAFNSSNDNAISDNTIETKPNDQPGDDNSSADDSSDVSEDIGGLTPVSPGAPAIPLDSSSVAEETSTTEPSTDETTESSDENGGLTPPWSGSSLGGEI